MLRKIKKNDLEGRTIHSINHNSSNALTLIFTDGTYCQLFAEQISSVGLAGLFVETKPDLVSRFFDVNGKEYKSKKPQIADQIKQALADQNKIEDACVVIRDKFVPDREVARDTIDKTLARMAARSTPTLKGL